MTKDTRIRERISTDGAVETAWTADSQKYFEQCNAVDLSETGVAIECPEPIALSANVIVWAPAFQISALAQVRHCSWKRTSYVLGLEFLAKTTTVQEDPCAPDHYEILRLSPFADMETIGRVYRTLAKRFHPDNPKTGDAEAFLRISMAYCILANPAKRRGYDRDRDVFGRTPRFQFSSPDFFWGIGGEQNRRLAVLSLLYRQRTVNYDSPGLTLLDLEGLTGCTREELGFTMWYLCEQRLAKVSDRTEYCVTAEGVDFVEIKLPGGRAELRALAAVGSPKEPESAGASASFRAHAYHLTAVR